MISIVLSALGLLALFSWVIAVLSAIRIVGLAPKGEKFSTYMKLGWWKFADIRPVVGPAGDPPIQAYQRAFIAFFVIIILIAGASILLGAQAQN